MKSVSGRELARALERLWYDENGAQWSCRSAIHVQTGGSGGLIPHHGFTLTHVSPRDRREILRMVEATTPRDCA